MQVKNKKASETILASDLTRLQLIDREIASGSYPTAAKLAKLCEASTTVITHDIAYMKEMLGAPITLDEKRKGLCYTQRGFKLPDHGITAEGITAFAKAKELLAAYRKAPQGAAAKQLVDGISAPFAGKSGWYENRILVQDIPHTPFDEVVWAVIALALRDNRELSFEYKGFTAIKFKPLRVRPSHLICEQGVWVLYAYDIEQKSPCTFLLSRMKKVCVSGTRFELPKDSVKYDGHYFAVLSSAKKYRFRISFSKEAAEWVRDRTWAGDQTIREKEGGILIEFTSSQYEKVMSWMFSQGGLAKPLGPADFVEDWRARMKALWKLYCS
ncbi:MAG: WYL domain-containing protein [Spirochaetaceae bacterium]|nr:WYL domain-containing protein [Spirochaetaceae bacterium]